MHGPYVLSVSMIWCNIEALKKLCFKMIMKCLKKVKIFEWPVLSYSFLCLRYEVAGGIMFSGCPSVRKSVRTSRSRDRVIWRTDWWNPAKLWSCMYLAEPMNWLDFGVTRSMVKGLIMYAKTARDRVISRTDWWIPAKLRSCMLLAELMNWLDFGVIRSRSKVMRFIMYANMACDRIIIRTDW